MGGDIVWVRGCEVERDSLAEEVGLDGAHNGSAFPEDGRNIAWEGTDGEIAVIGVFQILEAKTEACVGGHFGMAPKDRVLGPFFQIFLVGPVEILRKDFATGIAQ